MLKRELEKERQSKMALENMIIVSSLNMIGKIEVLEKKHESQIEHLREQIQHYAEKEHENTSVIKSLEDMNAKLRKQVLELEKKQQKDGKETKRKRNVKVDDEKDEKKDAWDGTSSTGKMKRSKSDSSTGIHPPRLFSSVTTITYTFSSIINTHLLEHSTICLQNALFKV